MPEPVRAPDLQRLGHSVLLQGNALTLLNHLANAGAAEMSRRNGFLTPSTTTLLGQLARADAEARSARGQADVREPVELEESESLDTGEVARVLGVTPRHVRRLACSELLPASRSGRDWHFRRSEVEAYLAQSHRDDREQAS